MLGFQTTLAFLQPLEMEKPFPEEVETHNQLVHAMKHPLLSPASPSPAVPCVLEPADGCDSQEEAPESSGEICRGGSGGQSTAKEACWWMTPII